MESPGVYASVAPALNLQASCIEASLEETTMTNAVEDDWELASVCLMLWYGETQFLVGECRCIIHKRNMSHSDLCNYIFLQQ